METCLCMPQQIDLLGGLSRLGGFGALGQNSAIQTNPINSILSLPAAILGSTLQTLQGLPLVGFLLSG